MLYMFIIYFTCFYAFFYFKFWSLLTHTHAEILIFCSYKNKILYFLKCDNLYCVTERNTKGVFQPKLS